MTDIILRNLSVAHKPRSMRTCEECKQPAFPGLPRYRAQYFEAGKERDVFLHVNCSSKWFARFLKDHRDRLKAANKGTV